jgi:hypothetical protein
MGCVAIQSKMYAGRLPIKVHKLANKKASQKLRAPSLYPTNKVMLTTVMSMVVNHILVAKRIVSETNLI